MEYFVHCKICDTFLDVPKTIKSRKLCGCENRTFFGPAEAAGKFTYGGNKISYVALLKG
jgi:hypothetical protein